MTDDQPVFISRLHERIRLILDELDRDVERIMITCNDGACEWFKPYYPKNHETTSMMAARMDADVLDHTKRTDCDHIDYNVGIEAKPSAREIDCTIVVGDTE